MTVIIPLLIKYNKPIWTDLHDYNEGNPYHEDFIGIADYLFVSSDNIKNYRSVMEKWMERGKELVVCTQGKNGSTALTKDKRWIETPIIEEYILNDANGAEIAFSQDIYTIFLKVDLLKSVLGWVRFVQVSVLPQKSWLTRT